MIDDRKMQRWLLTGAVEDMPLHDRVMERALRAIAGHERDVERVAWARLVGASTCLHYRPDARQEFYAACDDLAAIDAICNANWIGRDRCLNAKPCIGYHEKMPNCGDMADVGPPAKRVCGMLATRLVRVKSDMAHWAVYVCDIDHEQYAVKCGDAWHTDAYVEQMPWADEARVIRRAE